MRDPRAQTTGWRARVRRWLRGAAPSRAYSREGQRRAAQIGIVGAGISGIAMGIQLKRAGIHSFTIYEKSAHIGGTWRDNTYPGAGCDVPSHLYQFSFAHETDWSRRFGEQPEILRYLEQCVDEHGLRSHIRFETEITDARFDEAHGRWHLSTRSGERLHADVLVTGCGQLNRPFYPRFPGLDSFEGAVFHSARWDHDHDLRGERVAVIGNGASAIQFVPRIAPETKHLTVFQRSAKWIIPKPDRPYPEWERALYRKLPFLVRMSRYWLYLQLEARFLAFRQDSWLGWLMEKYALRHMRKQVSDPRLRETLTPDYPLGCKRILISNDYYPTLERDNVSVVTSPIDRIRPDGIVTRDGAFYSADALIFATGFESTSFLAPMEVRGRDGTRLEDVWHDGAEAHLGVTVSGFPNFFMLYGPNTNLGHNSIIFMIECQVSYVIQCIQELVERGLLYLDVRPEAMQHYNTQLQEEIADSVWAAGCNSWYKTDSGKITNNWSSFTTRYWWQTREPDLAEYEIHEAPAVREAAE